MIPVWPTLNATLNGFAALFLASGFWAIRQKNQRLHRRLMLAALTCSAVFLVSYVGYHAFGPGITHYQGRGFLRPLYFTILLTHTPLAVAMLPFVGMAIYHAARSQFEKHKRITRWLLPVWFYVSVTGVLVWVMLYLFPFLGIR